MSQKNNQSQKCVFKSHFGRQQNFQIPPTFAFSKVGRQKTRNPEKYIDFATSQFSIGFQKKKEMYVGFETKAYIYFNTQTHTHTQNFLKKGKKPRNKEKTKAPKNKP